MFSAQLCPTRGFVVAESLLSWLGANVATSSCHAQASLLHQLLAWCMHGNYPRFVWNFLDPWPSDMLLYIAPVQLKAHTLVLRPMLLPRAALQTSILFPDFSLFSINIFNATNQLLPQEEEEGLHQRVHQDLLPPLQPAYSRGGVQT